jgi:hypothetical protein
MSSELFENLLAQKIESERSLAGVCEVKAADLITKKDAALARAWSSTINNDGKADDSPEACPQRNTLISTTLPCLFLLYLSDLEIGLSKATRLGRQPGQ